MLRTDMEEVDNVVQDTVLRFICNFVRPDLCIMLSKQPNSLNIVSAQLQHLEFEIRLCKPSLDGRVDPTVTHAQWDRMLSQVRIMRNRGPEVMQARMLNRYGRVNENVSSLHPYRDDDKTQPVEYRMKRKLGTLDMAATGPFDLRFAASLELPLDDAQKPSDAQVTERFLKSRWSFVFFSTIRCDFTRLDPVYRDAGTFKVNRDTPIYQVELEIVDLKNAIDMGMDPKAIWKHVRELVSILVAAADGQRHNIKYSILKQRMYTRVMP